MWLLTTITGPLRGILESPWNLTSVRLRIEVASTAITSWYRGGEWNCLPVPSKLTAADNESSDSVLRPLTSLSASRILID